MSVLRREDVLQLLRSHKEDFANRYGVISLGLFGSVARDEAKEESDVDIYIKTKTPDAFALVHLKEEIEDLVGKYVDIVRFREKMNPHLKERIDKEGVYV
jgi:hypothetical protein